MKRMNESPWKVGDTLLHASALYDCVGFEKYNVVKLTPKGAWLEGPYDIKPCWRSFGTYFVSKTEEEAKAHLVRRKQRYVQHCKRRLREAERQLEVALEGKPAPRLQHWSYDLWGGDWVPNAWMDEP